MSAPWRAAIMIVAIFAMLGVAMAAGSAAHFHERSNSGQCDICVTAHAVSLEAGAVVHWFGAVVLDEQVDSGETIPGYQLLLAHSSFSRGPPRPR